MKKYRICGEICYGPCIVYKLSTEITLNKELICDLTLLSRRYFYFISFMIMTLGESIDYFIY